MNKKICSANPLNYIILKIILFFIFAFQLQINICLLNKVIFSIVSSQIINKYNIIMDKLI